MQLEQNYIILPDIRSSYNVGSIFRTADALGVLKIFLVGYTPCPYDKFKRPNKEIAKTALGAEKTIEWEHVDDIFMLLGRLKKDGIQIIAIEQAENSVDYKKIKLKDKNAFLFGSEVGGVTKEVLEKCDLVAEIPMLGKKESLNVSVSAGVALFRILDI
ncbi:MAG: RNA methyltransferase [Candidatus Paceibacterota bacterium]|jgi:tRNA G18 (ribose-2'-O)-methylase SpoU|nr:RNA methyltransferase [Candidatus Paceibacterota bacterium]